MNEKVSEHIENLDHPFKAAIAELRSALLVSDVRVTDKIKWNAPSFGFNGDDRVTFKLQPRDCFQIVLHRGTKKHDRGVNFNDPSGLIIWAAADRGVITVKDNADFNKNKDTITELAARWMTETS